MLIDNHGLQSIGGLSAATGSSGFGTRYRYRDPASGQLDGANRPSLRAALAGSRAQPRTTVTIVATDPKERVPAYEAWWDLAVAEASEMDGVQAAQKKERYFL